MEKDIYDLNLHEKTHIANNDFPSGIYIIRVAGGWIYYIVSLDVKTFIPFNNEFQLPNSTK